MGKFVDVFKVNMLNKWKFSVLDYVHIVGLLTEGKEWLFGGQELPFDVIAQSLKFVQLEMLGKERNLQQKLFEELLFFLHGF